MHPQPSGWWSQDGFYIPIKARRETTETDREFIAVIENPQGRGSQSP